MLYRGAHELLSTTKTLKDIKSTYFLEMAHKKRVDTVLSSYQILSLPGIPPQDPWWCRAGGRRSSLFPSPSPPPPCRCGLASGRGRGPGGRSRRGPRPAGPGLGKGKMVFYHFNCVFFSFCCFFMCAWKKPFILLSLWLSGRNSKKKSY